jgi:hypothetical protein
VLRTAVVKDDTIHVQAGAGIVADSDPAYEQRGGNFPYRKRHSNWTPAFAGEQA